MWARLEYSLDLLQALAGRRIFHHSFSVINLPHHTHIFMEHVVFKTQASVSYSLLLAKTRETQEQGVEN